VNVSLIVTGAPLRSLVPLAITFHYRQGEPSRSVPPQIIDLRGRAPHAPLNGARLANIVGAGSGGRWLSVEFRKDEVLLNLTPDVESMLPQAYDTVVRIEASSEEALTLVNLLIAPAPPRPQPPPPPMAAPSAPDPCSPAQAPAEAVRQPKIYNGRTSGRLSWTGALPSGACVALGESEVPIHGGGSVSGQDIPPTDVEITGVTPEGIVAHVLPATGARRVVLINSTAGPLRNITLNWRAKK
jgi:hypothetical protein